LTSKRHDAWDWEYAHFERLVRRLREDSKNQNSFDREFFDNELIAMANDPEIQAELKQIDQEFAVTETDGLARA
jgi:hypothetical protein